MTKMCHILSVPGSQIKMPITIGPKTMAQRNIPGGGGFLPHFRIGMCHGEFKNQNHFNPVNSQKIQTILIFQYRYF